MESSRKSSIAALTLVIGVGIAVFGSLSAAADNRDVLSLDKKNGQCPCFDIDDVAELIENSTSPMCTYNFNVDRRLRVFDADKPSDQVFTRAGVACYGPKVRAGNAPGLPGVGSHAMYDSEGRSCREDLLRAASAFRLECACVNQDGQIVECPDSL